MEKELIGPVASQKLKMQNLRLALLGVAWLLLFGGWVAVVFLFQSRAYEYLWIALGSLVSTLFLAVLLYGVLKAAVPLWAALRFARKVAKKDHVLNDIVLVCLNKELETYEGLLTRSVTVREIDEGTVWTIRYDAEADLSLKAGGHYAVETYDEVLLRIKEKE